MNSYVNVAIQIVPRSSTVHPYNIVDTAIEVIKSSGLKYMVCPFETVIEGEYHRILQLVEQIHNACYSAGAEDILCYIKIQSSANQPVTINDKMTKYS